MSNRSNESRGNFLGAFLEELGDWFMKHMKIVMPIVLAVCVITTIVVSVNANKKEAEKQEDIEANNILEAAEDEEAVTVIPEVPLEENTNPKISELIEGYYTAMTSGDIDAIQSLVSSINDEQILRIEETSKYIDSYPTLEIYTKTGPLENTYLVYVCSEVKFYDYEQPIPGMNTYYVCVDEDGKYYLNFEDEDQNESTLNYIQTVSLQDDVIDLNNKVTASYNDMVAADADLAQFILDLYDEIDKNIGSVVLAQAEEEGQSEEGEEGSEADAEESGTATVVTKVKAIDVVNIRSSDSETADKLGKAAIGDEFKLIEKIGNGWSRVEYEGKNAFIKSEYLEDVETTEVAANNTQEEETASQATQETSNNVETNGTVTVKTSVRVRAGASENSEKLGTAFTGETLELIMKQADGWTKVKYNGQVAYVKSEYVE